MNEASLEESIKQYNQQLSQVQAALAGAPEPGERAALLSLRADLEQLVALTRESLSALAPAPTTSVSAAASQHASVDDEYALFMLEMAKSGAYDDNKTTKEEQSQNSDSDSDLEDELTSLPGTKCGVYHTHKWGGQPTLHNAMVAALEARSHDNQLKHLQVRVLFTHPTHAEMLPCPFYLEGECRFSDEQCRYSHGELVPFSTLQEAIEPKFENLKLGSYVLVKLKPPDGEDISLTKKSSEKFHLWHRGVVKSIKMENRVCRVQLEQGGRSGEKRGTAEEVLVPFEELFPLNDESQPSCGSEDSLSDTELPPCEQRGSDSATGERDLLVEKSLQYNGPAMGEWERHTRGIGSKLMFAMGYVAGTGLGVTSEGRLEPVPARVLPVGKSLDHCMTISEKNANQDPLKVEQKLQRLQKKEEERNRKAYEREQEREKQNVFNFLNKTLGDQDEPAASHADSRNTIKQSSSKNLNIEQFKITEEVKRVEKDIVKLKNSLYRHAQGSNIHKNISVQLAEKSRELDSLQSREQDIVREQSNRKDKKKLTLF